MISLRGNMYELTTIHQNGRVSKFVYSNYQDAKKALRTTLALGLKASLFPEQIIETAKPKKKCDDEPDPDFSEYQ